MKKTFYTWLAPCLLFLLSGCAASSVVTQSNAIKAPGAALGEAKTFAWIQPTPASPADFDKGFSAELDMNIRKSVEENLKAKGLEQVDSKPDVLVAYDVSVDVPLEKDRMQQYAEGFGYGYAHMAGYRYNYINPDMPGYRPVDLYKQGTLIVDLVDPKSNTLLWRGWAEGAITDMDARYKQIQQQVNEVLQKLTL